MKNRKIFSFIVANYKAILAIVSLLMLFAVCLVLAQANKRATSPNLLDYTVVLDAGHGGVDGGVVGKSTGVKESDLNLSYAACLKSRLSNAGFDVVMTRTDKGGLYGLATVGFKRRDMEERRRIIEESKANMVISIHMNKYASESRRGAQVFFQRGDDGSAALAHSIQRALNKFDGYSYSALSGDFFVCRTSSVPAVIVECGFLSNPDEEQLLQQEDYREGLVNAIFEGLMLYLYNYG